MGPDTTYPRSLDILRTPEGGGFLRTRTAPRWSLSVGLPVFWQVPTFILTWRIRRFVGYDDSGYRQVGTRWCGFVLPQGHALTLFKKICRIFMQRQVFHPHA